jgi:hypothetical protein
MLLRNRDAFCDAPITDMCRCARDKPSDVIGLAAAKRIAQMISIEMRLHRDRKMSDTVAVRVCYGICEPLASGYLDRGIFASSEASQLRAAIRN